MDLRNAVDVKLNIRIESVVEGSVEVSLDRSSSCSVHMVIGSPANTPVKVG